MQEHLDWFLRRYLELLYDTHGERMWSEEDGADHKEEIARRLKELDPEYSNFFLPADLQ